MLKIAYNVVRRAGARRCRLRRNNKAFLDLLGGRAIPDPTTAGDFCRRFDSAANWRLMDGLNDARMRVWKMSHRSLTQETARIDRRLSPQEVVAESNDRCNQENIHAQLKSSQAALPSTRATPTGPTWLSARRLGRRKLG